ncbi:hypothetical protein PRIPAC_80124 [Pristionchus pacificus]|uniref:Uncharacterized protein n=1 Tax=Pristionchus pacificus TaxID=54126 RepID=A0A2A6C341_PRIPA|nr:hypothetical protein PRIPAC_80124 [Pristionchus pacificus]|eukprot:PDM72546.1 hypothetical protein PRIPAC_38980 [Pristionchus pacificus]
MLTVMNNDSDTTISHGTSPFFLVYLAQLLFNGFSICVAIMMLRIVQATQLHPNCKYLLKMWSCGYLSIFIANFGTSTINVLAKELPIRKIGPPLRSYFLDASVSAQFVCALLEIAIASERLMSAVRPAKYYNSGQSRCILYPATIVVLLIAAGFGYITEVSSDHLADASAILIIDISTLTVNTVSVRYCRNQFERMHGKVSLNARYQIREAQEIASSMQRSYVVCFFFKNLFNCFVLVGCAYTDENHYCRGLVIEMPYHFIESAYTGGLSCTSCYLLYWLMTNHPRLRRKLIVLVSVVWYAIFCFFFVCVPIIAMISRSTKVEPGSIADIRMSYQDRTEADVYFESLNKTWA